MYPSELEDYLLQYANCSTLEILMHSKTTYGLINPQKVDGTYQTRTLH
jgi:hypothetical protein